MKRLKTLATATTMAIAVIAATDGTASAEAKCKVTPTKPLVKKVSNLGGGEYFLWGHAYISGCKKTDYVQLFLAEESSPPGHWVSQGRNDLYPGQNAFYESLRIYLPCETYGGVGRFSTSWRINKGRLKRSKLKRGPYC